VQHAPKHGCGLVKRQVADEHMERRWKAIGQEVVGNDVHV
jgi:hypothetical protein